MNRRNSGISAIGKIFNKSTGFFVGGVLFGTAGLKILASKDARKAYVQMAAAALRAKDYCLKVANDVQAGTEDIMAEAEQVNEERAAAEKAAVVEDDAQA